MFQGINWRRIFVDLGWAMAAADPLCYSYYLAYRAQGAGPGRAGDVGESRALQSSSSRVTLGMPELANISKLLHVAIAFWFVGGLLGRTLAQRQARRSEEIMVVDALC